MKTQYYAAASLDGFIATDDDSLDWLFDAAKLGDSTFAEFIAGVGALAMGATTYEWMVRNADKVAAETGSTWPYSQPTWVFTSRRLPRIEQENAKITFVKGDVRDVHAQMSTAAAGKNLWVVGGGNLAAQFFDAGLLDELIVQVVSVTLERGRPLFPRRALYPTLSLTSARLLGPGMAELRYAVATDHPRGQPNAPALLLTPRREAS